MTYQEAYQKATGELKAAGIPEPESDAWILLEHVTGMTRTRYYVDGFERMPKNEEDRFFELVSCRMMSGTGTVRPLSVPRSLQG